MFKGCVVEGFDLPLKYLKAGLTKGSVRTWRQRHRLCMSSVQLLKWDMVTNVTVHKRRQKENDKQECIPVGYVMSATVAVCWGVSTNPPTRHPLDQEPPRAAPRHPWEQAAPCKACWDTTYTPWNLLQGILGYHPQKPATRHARIPARHAGIPTPSPREQTHTCKNITFATSLRTVKTHHCRQVLTDPNR